jgi:hypothetical protein
MITRAQLEEILTTQRACTRSVHPSTPCKRDRRLINALTMIEILAASGKDKLLGLWEVEE